MAPEQWLPGLAVVLMFTAASWLLAIAERERTEARRHEIRFRLFAARDRLYLAAVRGLVPPQSTALSALRNVINTMIRDESRWDINHLVAVMASEPSEEPAMLAALSKEARIEFMGICSDVASAFLELMRLNSRLVRVFIWLRAITHRLEQRSSIRSVEDVTARLARLHDRWPEAGATAS